MRILIVSDIHANLTALDTVVRDAEQGGAIDAVWSLGDNVGYGPQPAECLSRLRELKATMIAGNHDRAATGARGIEEFNSDAAAAALWTREHLSEDDQAFLDELPEVSKPVDSFTIVHGTLRYPVWEYLYSYEAAQGHLALQETPFSFVGHTHVPLLVVEDERDPPGCELRRLDDGSVTELTDDARLVLNPGSVGQPRDGDRRASYAIYDTSQQTVAIKRVEYEFAETQKLMREAELPAWLIERLAVGR
ncbi:MAG: metallophosphoesterase family protein [Dehalococcoidia bacterium]